MTLNFQPVLSKYVHLSLNSSDSSCVYRILKHIPNSQSIIIYER